MRFITKKTVQSQLQCPLCGSDVVSFWDEQNKKHVIPLTIGFSFFISAIIYNLWRFFVRDILTRDYIVTAVYIVLTVILAVYAVRFRKKTERQEVADLTTDEILAYRIQYFYVLIMILIVQVISIVIDYFLI
ncbi:MAG: hypothetical protein KGD64_08575 [Candidatus Heimdallarchaeota archaeon]|nr:hypothetical protein [Candidatus Heimdallarchaeota archaeon]